MRLVVLERARIDDPDAGEGEAGLFLEEGDVLDEAEGEGMLATVQYARIEQAVDIGGFHRPISDTALGARNFDGRLEPVHREPVRTISTSSPRFSAALNRARATSSALTQSAPESREMNTFALMPAPL
jgi:hypothetical protein